MSISRWMDKKAVVHIHNGVLLSHSKEYIWISSNEVDETRFFLISKKFFCLKHLTFIIFIFYWRIIALQNFAVFCQTSTWIRHVSEWVKVAQSCPSLCGPMYYTVHGILQARILEWVAFPFSKGSSQPRTRTQVSHIAGRFFTSWATREAQGKTYESGIGIHISPPFWTSSQLPPHPTLLGWYRAPVWVSWAMQQVPVGYLFYIW